MPSESVEFRARFIIATNVTIRLSYHNHSFADHKPNDNYYSSHVIQLFFNSVQVISYFIKGVTRIIEQIDLLDNMVLIKESLTEKKIKKELV